ncbi:MAG: dihydropteroate synthase [Nitrospinae bacterium]|nr:dihydropteroate synthase [Nitrospinota bacterium]
MPLKSFKVGGVTVRAGHPLIMGVLNVTPDSFSDGGRYAATRGAVARALEMEREGANILDIGGESSRPGAAPVTTDEELRRVVPVIAGVRKKSSIPISIDTAKADVAHAALEAGADIINDITGFINSAMVAVAARHKAAVIVMHMQGSPRTMQKGPRYKNVVAEVSSFLRKQAATLEKSGVRRIILDPGIGFGKTVEHNLALLKNLPRLKKLGYPVMVGASRKSFIGALTGAGVDDRLPGTLAAHLWAVSQGAAIVRAHDVAAHRQALEIIEKIAVKPV